MKKWLSLILAGLMLLSVTACGNANEDPTDTKAPGESDTGEQETEDRSYMHDLPDDLDYGDEVIHILYADSNGRGDELVDDGSESVVSVAVHDRNLLVQDQLKVVLEMFPESDSTAVVNAMKQDINSGSGDYDIVANGTYLSVQPAMEGYYVNLTPLENIDTSKSYWTQGYNDMVTFTDANMQFLASGPIAISMFRYMFFTIYNKQLFENNGLTDLYEVVKNNEWTLDYQYSVLADHSEDVDGNGVYDDKDFYGFVTGDIISVDPYAVATDVHLINKDAETGMLRFNTEDVARLVDVCDKVQKIYNDQSTYVYSTATKDDVQHNFIISHFGEGRALMATTLFWQLELNFDNLSQLSYGIAPMPKFDTLQETYNSYVQDQVTCFGISAVVGDTERQEMCAAVLESMAYHSNRLVRPAYYETALSDRYMQDPQSGEVLEMIFDTLRFDFSSSCSNIFTGCVIRDNLRPILSGSSNTISSSATGWAKNIDRTLERKYNTKLEEMKPE